MEPTDGRCESYVVGIKALYLLFQRRKWGCLEAVGVGREWESELDLFSVVYGKRIDVLRFVRLYPDLIEPAINLVGMFQMKVRSI
jgi:hypothetical protein